MVALLNYLGLIGSFLSASLVLPALIGFGTDDYSSGYSLLVYGVLGGFISIAILLATQGRAINLNRVSSIYLAVVSWLFFPLVLAIPLSKLFGIAYVDAVFEAVSAFTTTAADGISNPETAAPAAIFFRANLQWVGGLATLLTAILFFGPIRAGGMPKPRMSAGEAVGRTTTGVNRVAWNMFRYFLSMTLICFALLMLSGVDAFSSLILASTAMTAGGYVPRGQELLDLVSPLSLFVMSFFFVMAATNVFWHRMIVTAQLGELRRHRESYYLISIIFVFIIIFSIVISKASGNASGGDGFQRAGEAVFNAASLASTSGLQTRSGIFALLPVTLVLSVLMVGAGCFSVGGGIKLYRIGAMLFHAGNELSRLIYPHGISRSHFGSETYGLPIMKSIWTMFVAAVIVVLLSTNLLALSGMDFQASLIASVAAFTNAGPAYSLDWAPRGAEGWFAYSQMLPGQKMILAGVMLCGRLEVVALIVALNPFYWLRQ